MDSKGVKTGDEGKAISLTCSVLNYNENTCVLGLMFNSTQLNRNEMNYYDDKNHTRVLNYTINNPITSQHAGIYTCILKFNNKSIENSFDLQLRKIVLQPQSTSSLLMK